MTAFRSATLLLLLVLATCQVHAQAGASHKALTSQQRARFGELVTKIRSFRRTNQDSTLYYGRTLYREAARTGDPFYTACGANAIGMAKSESNVGDSVTYYMEIALKGFEQTDSIRELVFAAEALSQFYIEQGRQELALERLKTAMRYAEGSHDSSSLAKVHHRIATIHDVMHQYPLSILESRKSLAINLAMGQRLPVSVNYNSLGSCFVDMGMLDSARYYFAKSLQLKEQLKDLKGIGSVLNNMAIMEVGAGNFDEADALLKRAIAIGKKTGVKTLLALGQVNQGYCALKRGQPARAIALLLAAQDIPEVQNNLVYKIEAATNLATAYAQVGDFANAYRYQQSYLATADSMRQQDMAAKVLTLQNEIEAQRHLREMAELNAHSANQEIQIRNRQALILVLGAIVLLIFAATLLLWLRYRIRTREHDRLNALNQLKSRFFSNISHEFKTPLSLILGPLDRLMASTEPGSEERVLYALMQRNARQLLDLNNQLLDLARLESGKMQLRDSEMPWQHSLSAIASAFLPDAARREVGLEIVVEAGDHEALADRNAVEKILNNLLSNALKHTPGGGSITFTATLIPGQDGDGANAEGWEAAYALLTVHDSGKGIPQDDLDRIFDRFYQVESDRQAGTPGTGIGLALVRELVQLMDGEIDVQSRMGEGSTFSVRLPLQIRPGSGQPQPASDPEEVSQAQGAEGRELPRLLIVEDNEEMRDYMRREFAIAFEVVVAENGRIGLEKAIDETPDIVISDLMMPEMDGIALCAALKSSPATSHVPFILLTALGSVEDRVRGLEEGADDYLQKPFHAGELMARARNLIEQRRALRRLWSQPDADHSEAPVSSLNRLDQEFLERAMAVTREHMADPAYSVETFSREMHMSRPQLFRKIKALTDQNLSEFIRTVRLREAGRLFSENFGNVTEVLYAVGFNNSSYFSKCFREMYGMAPSDYAEQFRARSK
jgi:signal transduction histidine kinase/DNA-binding response OmpR family regulator